MNIVLDSSLTRADDHWPLALATYVLSPRHMLQVAWKIRDEIPPPDEKIIAIMSLDAFRAMERFERDGCMDAVREQFEFQLSDCMTRCDWVNGNWKERTIGTPEYFNASFEDAVICMPHEEKARMVLRFRRMIPMDYTSDA